MKALARGAVLAIVERFRALNPYDRNKVPDSILKVEKVNRDAEEQPRALLGFAISAKRYVLYTRQGDALDLIEPKAHGLGYLCAPKDARDASVPPWTAEAWEWMLRGALRLPRVAPPWLTLPAMMRITVSTPVLMGRVRRHTRPFSFVLCPLIDRVVGLPMGAGREHLTLITRYTKKPDEWINARCINVHDGQEYRLAQEQTARHDRVIPQTLDAVLRLYLLHPEAKSLAPDGTACTAHTRGLLQRARIVAGEHHPIGKEADRRWEHGEDLSLLQFNRADYRRPKAMVVADAKLRERMAACGLRELMRKTGLHQHTVEKIRRGQPVRSGILDRAKRGLES